MKKKVILVLVCIMLLSMLTGCVPGDGTHTGSDPAGFFYGIWHGWLAPVSIILSFFNSDIRIYEVMNVGILYDIGFYIAIISGFGGLSLSRKSKKCD